MSPADIVQKLWNYCNVLRDDGMSYGDYVEQLTYLLFLKMADERTKPPYKESSIVPNKYLNFARNSPAATKRRMFSSRLTEFSGHVIGLPALLTHKE